MAGARPFSWEHSRGVVLEEILVMGIDADRVDGMLLWTKTLASAG